MVLISWIGLWTIRQGTLQELRSGFFCTVHPTRNFPALLLSDRCQQFYLECIQPWFLFFPPSHRSYHKEKSPESFFFSVVRIWYHSRHALQPCPLSSLRFKFGTYMTTWFWFKARSDLLILFCFFVTLVWDCCVGISGFFFSSFLSLMCLAFGIKLTTPMHAPFLLLFFHSSLIMLSSFRFFLRDLAFFLLFHALCYLWGNLLSTGQRSWSPLFASYRFVSISRCRA